MALRTLSLCSGIGGMELGLRAAMGDDYRTVCYVEREAYAAACIVARIQEGLLCDAPVWSDMRTFDPQPWRGRVDLITGGYPCQPFSAAGRRKGAQDERHLWPIIAKIVAAVRPIRCFFENVPGHVSLGMERVATDLQAMGYDVSAGIFSAAQVGAPHERKRLFILADSHVKRELQSQGSEQKQRRWPSDGGAKNVADAVCERSGKVRSGTQVRQWVSDAQWQSWWSSEPNVGRVADGVPARMDRLAALGNAIVPATAALAWRTLTGDLDHGLS